jgi:hypothetical protein
VFQPLQLTERVQLKPTAQLFLNPAQNPRDDVVLLVGLQARAGF